MEQISDNKMNTKGIIIFIGFAILGIVFLFINLSKDNKVRQTAPKINYDTAINIYVNTVSFERNGFFINDIDYNSYGISSYSRIHLYESKNIVTLNKIKPPYHLYKKENNDTLNIDKKNIRYYLKLKEEINYAN